MPSFGLVACLAVALWIGGQALPDATVAPSLRRPLSSAPAAADGEERVIVGVEWLAPGSAPQTQVAALSPRIDSATLAETTVKGAILAAARPHDGAVMARLAVCLDETSAGAFYMDAAGLAVLQPKRCGQTPQDLCAAVSALGSKDIFCEHDAAIQGR
eukprot:9899505-Heterocapsa_arctica.AAC.1